MKNQVWRVIDILKWGEEYFKKKGFENSKREIEWLLCDLLTLKRIELYVQFEKPLENKDLNTLKKWIYRRLKKEPLQYITGKTEFYGRSFCITPEVLIPRPETERVVDVALHTIGNIKSPSIIDIGTGAGIIAVSLGAERPDARIDAIDISREAIGVAKKNAKINDIKNINFFVSDFLNEALRGPYDVMVSNPPYIPRHEMGKLMADVHEYEPRIALTDDSDGLTFYHRFSEVSRGLIRPGGWLILEIGLGSHPEKVKKIFQKTGFSPIDFVADFNGDDRVLKIQV